MLNCYSKPLGGYGDGGACFTDDEELATLMKQIRLHGQDRRYHHARIGINGRLDTLQAAVLLAKFDIFEQEIHARKKIGKHYTDLLKQQCPGITPPYIDEFNTSVYAQYTILVENRSEVQNQLKQAGIPTAVHYPILLNEQPALEQKTLILPVAQKLVQQVMSLPMHPYLTETEMEKIVTVFIK